MAIKTKNSFALKFFVSAICGIVGSLALFSTVSFKPTKSMIDRLSSVFFEAGPLAISLGALAVTCLVLLLVIKRKWQDPVVIVEAIILSVLTICGRSFDDLGSPAFFCGDAIQFLICVICLVGYFVLYVVAIGLLYWCLNSIRRFPRPEFENVSLRFIIICVAIIAIFWLPICIICWPGGATYDYIVQLSMFNGSNTLTNHHPVMMTFLFGSLYGFGCFLGSASYGVAITVCLQLISLLCVAACNIWYLLRLHVPRVVTIVTVLYYALCLIFPLYGVVLVKDVFSAAFMGLFLLQVASLLVEQRGDGVKIGTWLRLFIIAMLCSLSRNNCVYIVAPTLLALVYFVRKEYAKQSLSVALSVVSLYCIWTMALMPALGIHSGNIREALSLPTQQTAYYLAQYGESDLSDNERSSLNAVIDCDFQELASLYNYKLSDPVRHHFTFKSRDDLARYLMAWFSMGIRHPELYACAFSRGTFGYWYPFVGSDELFRGFGSLCDKGLA